MLVLVLVPIAMLVPITMLVLALTWQPVWQLVWALASHLHPAPFPAAPGPPRGTQPPRTLWA